MIITFARRGPDKKTPTCDLSFKEYDFICIQSASSNSAIFPYRFPPNALERIMPPRQSLIFRAKSEPKERPVAVARQAGPRCSYLSPPLKFLGPQNRP
jgi:hypothetical protein